MIHNLRSPNTVIKQNKSNCHTPINNCRHVTAEKKNTKIAFGIQEPYFEMHEKQ